MPGEGLASEVAAAAGMLTLSADLIFTERTVEQVHTMARASRANHTECCLLDVLVWPGLLRITVAPSACWQWYACRVARQQQYSCM